MKASELRIGNIIKDDRKAQNWRFVTARIIADMASDPNVDLYHPVEITEEWLLKFGFIKWDSSHSCYLKKRNSRDFVIFDWRTPVAISNNIPFGSFYCLLFNVVHVIPYVHQLQNLYFALTGEELKND